jgi:hypothetical protein
MSKTPTRIYVVKRQDDHKSRLVRATSQPTALRHVALDEYTVEVASQDDLVEAIGAGAQIEIASSTDAA